MATPNRFELEADDLEIIKALADEIGCPVEDVKNIFTSALQKLEASAQIKDYVHVLASKQVRDALRH
jgi:hypothetical protein